MSRRTKEELNRIKEYYNVEELFSYSKVSSFKECAWMYYLRYVLKVRPEESGNAWSHLGGHMHDLIQGHTEGLHSYDEMVVKFDQIINQYILEDVPHLRFPTARNSTSEKQRDKWIANLRHYFQTTKIMSYEAINEQFILIEFQTKYGLKVFQGYIDALIDEINRETGEGYVKIVDYKSSSKSGFSGEGLLEKAEQLLTYALGIHQQWGVPYDKIKLLFDMQKYVEVTFPLKKGGTNTTIVERRELASKIVGKIKKSLLDIPKDIEECEKEIRKIDRRLNAKKNPPEQDEINELLDKKKKTVDEIAYLRDNIYSAIEIESMISKALATNSLEHFPKIIQDKYIVNNWYIEIDVTEEIMEKYTKKMIATLEEIYEKEQSETVDLAFSREPVGSDSFYCDNLCDLRNDCKYYQQHRDKRNELYGKAKQEESKSLSFADIFGGMM